LAHALQSWHGGYKESDQSEQVVSASQIEALVGSELRARLLHWFYVEAQPGISVHEREIARRTGISPGSVHHALTRLEKGQLIVREETPRGPQYRAPYEDVRLQPLFTLFRQQSVLVNALRDALAHVAHVAYACIFGSFAQGTAGAASDVDVLVLEDSRDARQRILSALAKVQESTAAKIDITVMSVEKFRGMLSESDAFAVGVVGGPRIVLKGEAESWV
jgi:predicted nucleotidyltransferase